jgi:colanic acid/amylovoran biosynthesis glycosyltransferase
MSSIRTACKPSTEKRNPCCWYSVHRAVLRRGGTLELPLKGRIAYLISQYPAYNHTFILREVRQLRTMGWDIQTVSIRACDRPAAKLTPDEAEEYDRTLYVTTAGLPKVAAAHFRTFLRRPLKYIATALYALRTGHGGMRRLLYFAEAVTAGAWLESRGYTHVHAHFASTVALFIPKLFAITISATIHGPDEFNDPVGFCLREKVDASAFIVAISNFARSQLMRYSTYEHWSKIDVCYLGIDPYVFDRRPARSDSGPCRLICVARLAPVKGQHVLVDAMQTLIGQGREVTLSLVGDGPDRPALERHVAHLGLTGKVIFEGWCNQDRVKVLYKGSDIFVLASFAEGVPVVLMEAMAMEIPCIATRITGVPELIADRVEGLLVTPSDPAELAEAIARMIDSAELRDGIGRASREKVVSKFDLEKNVTALSRIFERRLTASG